MSHISKNVSPLILDGRPFTVLEAKDAGISAKQLRRLVRIGEIRAVLYGVYVDDLVPDSIPLRAAAVAVAAPPNTVICRRTAAWLYGIDTLTLQELSERPAVESVRPRDIRALKLATVEGHSQTLLPGDVIDWHGLRVTSPLATAVHLARHLHRPFGLAALDAMTRARLIAAPELIEAVRRYRWHPGIRQARELAVLVDPAAESPGESILRLRMIDAGFPHPVPQIGVTDGVRTYRLDLGFLDLPRDRSHHLGLEYDSDQWHSTAEQQRKDELRRRDLHSMNWQIMSVRRWQLWGKDAALERAVGEYLGVMPKARRW